MQLKLEDVNIKNLGYQFLKQSGRLNDGLPSNFPSYKNAYNKINTLYDARQISLINSCSAACTSDVTT